MGVLPTGLLLSLAIVLTASAAPPASHPAPFLTGQKLTDLQTRLNAGMPDVRHGAIDELASAGPQDLPALRSLERSALLSEVKTPIAQRIAAIEDDLAINPPPISMDVERGSLADVAAALSKATGCRFDAWPPPGRTDQYRPSNSYTLHMHDAGFWTVFSALSAQHPMFFDALDAQRLWLNDQGGEGSKDPVCVGPLALFPHALRIDRWIGTNPQGDGLRFFCSAAMDPRVRMVGCSSDVYSEAKDNLGTDLLAEKSEDRMSAFHLYSMEGTGSVHFKSPAAGAERMTIKGSTRIIVPLGEQAVEIPNANTQVGKTLHVADQDVKLTRLETKADGMAVYVKLERAQEGVPLNVSLINAEGTIFWAATTSGKEMFEGIGTNPPVTGPITLRLAVPRENRVVTLPFEFKDLPLPR